MEKSSHDLEQIPESILPRNSLVTISKLVDGQETGARTGRLLRDVKSKAGLYLVNTEAEISWIDPEFIGAASFHTGTVRSIELQADGSWHLRTGRSLYVLRVLQAKPASAPMRVAPAPEAPAAARSAPVSAAAPVPSLMGRLRELLSKIGIMKTTGNRRT